MLTFMLILLAAVFGVAVFLSFVLIAKLKLRIVFAIVFSCLCALCIVGLVVYSIPIDNVNNQAEIKQTIEQTVGISNDEEMSLIISDSISTTGVLEGTMFLFSGSIKVTEEDSLRMGYVAPNGDSYIFKVPISKIVFTQKVDAIPSGSFHFTNWNKTLTLQGNVDEYLKGINITLTPDEFKKLIK